MAEQSTQLQLALAGTVLLLGACNRAPAVEACNDFRVMTYYDNMSMPPTDIMWKGPITRPVCVVTETKIGRPHG